MLFHRIFPSYLFTVDGGLVPDHQAPLAHGHSPRQAMNGVPWVAELVRRAAPPLPHSIGRPWAQMLAPFVEVRRKLGHYHGAAVRLEIVDQRNRPLCAIVKWG